jgi:transcriptional regulator with XRE-family HTH domain
MNNLSQQLRAARLASGLTQEELAARMGTSQNAISRLENLNYAGHTLSTVLRYVQHTGHRVEISIIDRHAEVE